MLTGMFATIWNRFKVESLGSIRPRDTKISVEHPVYFHNFLSRYSSAVTHTCHAIFARRVLQRMSAAWSSLNIYDLPLSISNQPGGHMQPYHVSNDYPLWVACDRPYLRRDVPSAVLQRMSAACVAYILEIDPSSSVTNLEVPRNPTVSRIITRMLCRILTTVLLQNR